MSDAREWWIGHVIEFSAFEAMRRERDFWIEKYNIIMKEHLDLQFTLGKENEKLRAALDEIDDDKHISSTVGDLRRIAREALK